MKRILSLLSVAAAVNIGVSSVHAASARENKRLQEGKITKNEAQHLVLKKFPGATFRKCELKRGKDHSVWILDIVKSGDKAATQIQVDGRSGRIL